MARILKRPMFRRGGMPSNQGVAAIRPKYMGGGMSGIMTGINPTAGLTPRVGYQEGEVVQPSNTQGYRNYLEQQMYPKSLIGDTSRLLGNVNDALYNFIPRPLGNLANYVVGANEGFNTIKYKDSVKENVDKAMRSKGFDPNSEFETVEEGSNIEGSNIEGSDKAGKINSKTAKPISAAQDIKTVYEDILPLLQSTLGIDDSELNKQNYLELAKFGANLMSQPGGDLVGAVGKAAGPSLEGATRIAETRRQGNKRPSEIALNTALDIYKNKANNPTALKIKTLANLAGPDVSEEQVAKSFLTSTGEAQIKATQQEYLLKGAAATLGLEGPDGINYSKQITALIDAGHTSIAGNFKKKIPDREDLGKKEIGNYYVDDNGDLVRWNGKSILYIKDIGFLD
jgi:hypothetical protein